MKNILKVSFLFCFFLINCGENQALNQTAKDTYPFLFKAKVTAVKDGDTFKVLYQNREITIRLNHIDCPEKKQAYGIKAKLFAADICFGKLVTVKTAGKYDRYKRLIGEIILQDGTNVNKTLVKNGLAWHYKHYSQDLSYAKLEIVAKAHNIGIWSEKNPIAPWDWRKKKVEDSKKAKSLK